MLSSAIRLQARPASLALARRSLTVSASSSRRLLFALGAAFKKTTTTTTPSVVATAGLLSRCFSQSASAKLGFSPQHNNSPSRVLFVGNLPWSSTKEELQELFREFGEVVSVRIHTHADGRPRGFGHIEFSSKEHAIACFTSAMEEPIYFAGRDIVIDYAKDHTPQAQDLEPNNRLYFVGFSGGEDALKEVLASYDDDLVSIYFLRDGNTGDRLPRGFVEFKSVGIATEVLNSLHGSALPSGETLNLSYARPPRRRDQNSNAQNPRLANYRREKYTNRSWRSPE